MREEATLDDFRAKDEGGKGKYCPTREEIDAWQRDEERVREVTVNGRAFD